MTTSKYTVHLKPMEKTLLIDGDTDLLSALREEGIYVKSSCGGYASCSDCLVKVIDGLDNINTPSFEETQMIGNVFHITKERLACQVKVEGEVTIDLSRHDQSADAQKLKQKNNKFKQKKAPIKKRSKAEVDEILSERQQKREEKEVKRNSWEKHWTKEKDGIKRGTGGGKRPKTFRTDHLDDDPDFKKKED
jgi:ferredoxin